jgi:hypothetical protein
VVLSNADIVTLNILEEMSYEMLIALGISAGQAAILRGMFVPLRRFLQLAVTAPDVLVFRCVPLHQVWWAQRARDAVPRPDRRRRAD